MDGGGTGQIRYPFATAPAHGVLTEIAAGVFWTRLPLPMQLDHVNVYVLDDGDGWTVIDTGFDTPASREIWQALLDGPLAGRPLRRVIATHQHPDHIGLAGWFQAMGAELWTTRTAWLYARMLKLDAPGDTQAEVHDFWRAAGMPAEMIAARQRAALGEPPRSVVHPLPLGYHRLREGALIRMAGRDWQVRMGEGHAPEHATFWSLSDNLVIGGDQLLPGISANIGVYPVEPEADPLGDWLDSCRRFQDLADDGQLILPGHKLPFTGLPLRLRQMIENHDSALERLEADLATPRRASDCFLPLFRRRIEDTAFGLAMAEAVAHLNHLHRQGRVRRWRGADGAWLWQRQADAQD